MKKTLALVGLFVGLLSPTFGQFTDSFDATVSGRWGTPASTPVGPPTSGGATSILLSQDNVNSRVDWTLSLSSAPNSANRFMPLQSFGGSYDSNWTAELAVVNGFSPTSGQSTQIGLMAFNTNGMSAPPTADYLKLVLVQAHADVGGLAAGNVIHYGSHSNTAHDPFSTTPSAGSSATLKLVYAAGTHTIAVYNGGSLLRTFGIAGSGGDSGSNQSWGMNSGDTFTLGLYAQSETSGSGAAFTLLPGTAYADTLTATGLAAVPEPGTYAVIFGFAALGFAAWRRRRSG